MRLPIAAVGGWLVLATVSGGVAVDAEGAPSAALNACHVSPIVDNLDVAAHFYHDLLGLDLVPSPPPGPLPVDTDSGHLLLHGLPDARLRFIGARMPGVRCGIEVVELTHVDRRPVHRRYQDPGSATLVLTVRNLEGLLAGLKTAGVHVVTTGGAPVRITAPAVGAALAVTVQDPDRHYVELVQPDRMPETDVPAASNVVGIGLRLTVADAERAVAFYRTVLGIDGQVHPFEKSRATLALAGLPEGAEFRTAMTPIPGSSRTLEFIQFRGLDAATSPAPSRVQDPGSYRLQLTFRDIDATLAALEKAGSRTISTGGAPVTMTFGSRPWRLAVVPDPNNLFLVVQQAPSQSAGRGF